MILEFVFVFSVVFAVTFFLHEKWNAKKKPRYRLPPSLPFLPIIGSLPFIREFSNIAKFFMEKSLQLGPVFVFRAGNRLVLILNNKEVIEEAFVKQSRSFSSRPEMFMQKLINPRSKGIVFMDTTPEWKRDHQTSLSILKEFGFGDKNILEERIQIEAKAMIEYAKKKSARPFEPKELCMLMVSNIMTSIVFDFRRSYDLGISQMILETDNYVHRMDMIFDITPLIRFIPPFRQKISEMKICCKNLHDIIELETDKSLQSQKKCFVSEYVKKEGPNYDREQLKFLVRDLMAAGIDTTATTLQWSFLALANHPEIQRRLQRDIDTALPRDRLPMLEDKPRLPFMEATILEILRWRTLAPLSVARNAKQDSILRDFLIPAGTLVYPNLYAVHNDRTFWKDPEIFRPERFLDEEENVVEKDRMISFSLGPRSCLGKAVVNDELFLILTSLLQRFSVFPPEGQVKVVDEPSLPVELVAVPKAYSIRLIERQ